MYFQVDAELLLLKEITILCSSAVLLVTLQSERGELIVLRCPSSSSHYPFFVELFSILSAFSSPSSLSPSPDNEI